MEAKCWYRKMLDKDISASKKIGHWHIIFFRWSNYYIYLRYDVRAKKLYWYYFTIRGGCRKSFHGLGHWCGNGLVTRGMNMNSIAIIDSIMKLPQILK